MRVRLIGLCLFFTLAGPGLVYAAGPPQYYVALGDSLAVGVQPASNGTLVATNQGYVDDLFAFLHASDPGLRLKKLGCSGETTTTMLYGGTCYGLGSQLQQAVAFLQTHRVALVTLDIGGDDVLHCFSLSGPNPVCLGGGIAAVNANLPNILTALRAAAPDVPIVAMNYYDPFLAAWRLGAAGKLVASQSLMATLAFNSLLRGWYDVAGVPVADVAAAYHITNFTPVPYRGCPAECLSGPVVNVDRCAGTGRPGYSPECVGICGDRRRLREHTRGALALLAGTLSARRRTWIDSRGGVSRIPPCTITARLALELRASGHDRSSVAPASTDCSTAPGDAADLLLGLLGGRSVRGPCAFSTECARYRRADFAAGDRASHRVGVRRPRETW